MVTSSDGAPEFEPGSVQSVHDQFVCGGVLSTSVFEDMRVERGVVVVEESREEAREVILLLTRISLCWKVRLCCGSEGSCCVGIDGKESGVWDLPRYDR
jgi:hypothetical protein